MRYAPATIVAVLLIFTLAGCTADNPAAELEPFLEPVRATIAALEARLAGEAAERKGADLDTLATAQGYADERIAGEAGARAALEARLAELERRPAAGALHLFGPMGEDLGTWIAGDVAHVDDGADGIQIAYSTPVSVYFDRAGCGGSPLLYVPDGVTVLGSSRFIAGNGRLYRAAGVRASSPAQSILRPDGSCVPAGGAPLTYPASDTGRQARRYEATALAVRRAP